MTAFVALYAGRTIAAARLVAVSADPALIRDVSTRLLNEEAPVADPLVVQIERGHRDVLRVICGEAAQSARVE